MITWLNTTIGAVPGALPALGGWAASANELNPNAWILFAILFLWQHPHFYAIALMCKEDYKKAGFKMLPVIEEDNNRTNRQIIWHAFLLIPVSLFFVVTGVLVSTLMLDPTASITSIDSVFFNSHGLASNA